MMTTSAGGSAVLPESSRWPAVVGIIGIVFAALGLLGGCLGTLTVFALDFMRDLMEQAGQDTSTLDDMANNKALYGGMAIAALVLSILLLVAGVQILRRRRGAYGLTLTWALLKLLYVAGKVPVDYNAAIKQMEAMKDQSTPGASAVADMGPAIAIGSAAFNAVWGVALPIFMLIWLARPRVRREMSSW